MRKPTGALWSHRDFLKLWTGQTISEFGSQVSQLAIPAVAILTLKATPFEVAALETVVFLPFLILTLPAGVWVDRWRRRWILIGGDLPLIGGNARNGKSDIVVAEACEAYDGFLYLHPEIAAYADRISSGGASAATTVAGSQIS